MNIEWPLIFTLCSLLVLLSGFGAALVIGGLLLKNRRTKHEGSKAGNENDAHRSPARDESQA